MLRALLVLDLTSSDGSVPESCPQSLRLASTKRTGTSRLHHQPPSWCSTAGNKSYVVGIGLTLIAYYLCAESRRQGYRWFSALGVLVALGAIFDYLQGGYSLTTLLVRRALATAGLNTAYYFDFFSNNPRYGLHQSILSFAGSPPYQLSPPQLIGVKYYGSSSLAANANLIADGYANFGVLGCILMGIVFALYLRFVDKASKHLPLQVSGPALTLVLVAAANSAALTVLSTHGGLVLLVLMLCLPPVVRPSVRQAREHGHGARGSERRRVAAP